VGSTQELEDMYKICFHLLLRLCSGQYLIKLSSQKQTAANPVRK